MQIKTPKINSCFAVELVLFIITIIFFIIYIISAEILDTSFLGFKNEGSFGLAIISMFIVVPLAIISCIVAPIVSRIITNKELKKLDKRNKTKAELKLAFPTITLAIGIFALIIIAAFNS